MNLDYAKALRYAKLSQDVYQPFDSNIQFTDFQGQPVLLSDAKTDAQCALLQEGSHLMIIFRGSESSIDWNMNFDTKQERVEFDQEVIKEEIAAKREQIYPYESGKDSGALMHSGFAQAYLSVRSQIHDYLKTHEITSVGLTGHSLGGALATLGAVDVQYNFNQMAIEVYTFGAPKVGNKQFSESFNRRVSNSFQIVHGMDIVPALPRWWQGYEPVAQEVRFGKRFSWNFITQRFKDHAIVQYIQLFQR